MKILLALCSLFVVSLCNAQQQKVDSLLNLLTVHTQPDTARLTLLNEISYEYHTISPDKGLETAEQAIALAQRLGHEDGRGQAYLNKGVNYRVKGKDSLAMDMFEQAKSLFDRIERKRGLAKVYHQMGIVYFNRSDYLNALEHQQLASMIAGELHESEIRAAALNSLGVVYLYLPDYPRALDYFLKSLAEFEQSGNALRVGNGLTNIGIVYRRLSNYPKALEYSRKALEVATGIGNKQGMAGLFGNIGNIFDDMDSTAEALEAYHKGLAINRVIGNNRGVASALINIGIVYNKIRDYPNALEYLERARIMYEDLKDKHSLAIALREIGKVYRDAPDRFLALLGITPADRYRKSLGYMERSLQLGEEIDAVENQMFTWLELSVTYERQKSFSRALEAYKQYAALHDTILSANTKRELDRREMRYEFESREAALKAEHDRKESQAAQEIARQRIISNAVGGGSAVLLLAAATSFLFYKKRRDAEERRREAEFKAMVSETEMKALRSQMNPHFIFNSLNSIGDYISKHDIPSADRYLATFAKLMRLILHNSQQKEVPLSDDLLALDLYLQLERLRLHNKFSHEIQVDPAIDRETTLIPPLLLQPFVENSIWHGISKKAGAGKILILITKQDDMITCVVEDNGVGRKQAEAHPPEPGKQSLGIKITEARINILNKIKQSKASMQLFDLTEGTRVELRLPLVLNY